jgi:hypothetical protein
MLRVVPVAGETCSPGDQEEDYSFLLNVIRISLAIGAVGGQLIGHAVKQFIASAKRRMQARTSSATVSREVREESESAGADAGVAAVDPWSDFRAATLPENTTRPYQEAVQPTVPMTGAPTALAESQAAAASSADPPVPNQWLPSHDQGNLDEIIAAARAAGGMIATARAAGETPPGHPLSLERERRVPAVIRKDQRAGACRHCDRTPEERDTVIISPNGECYHDRPDCRGLIQAAKSSRRRPCLLCVGYKIG